MDVKISVIMPVYKAEKYLTKCVRSVLSQTCRELELILVEDGSPDGSPALCDMLAREDARIRVIHQENAGPSAARNNGIAAARGRYFAFFDADDWVEPDMLEQMTDSMEKTGADMAFCGHFVDFEDSGKSRTVCRPSAVMDRKNFCRFLSTGKGNDFVWNKVYTRELIRGVSFPEGKYYEDIRFLSRLLERCRKVSYVGKPFYHYVQHSGSITRSRADLRLLDGVEARLDRLQVITREFPEFENQARRQMAEFLLWIRYLIAAGDCDPRLREKGPELEQLLRDQGSGLGLRLTAARGLLIHAPAVFRVSARCLNRIVGVKQA